MVVYQVGALAAVAAAQGVRLQHVKAHGALYNMACRDEALAEAIARAVVATDGTRIRFEADTLCLHGDTPGAVTLAGAIRRGLEDAGVGIAPLTRR